MSFTPAHPSRFIFVGVTDRLWKKHNQKGARPGMNWLRLLGFAPLCDPFPRFFLIADRSCLGLCLLQGCGHTAVHSSRLDPARITSFRKRRRLNAIDRSYPLMGFVRSFPSDKRPCVIPACFPAGYPPIFTHKLHTGHVLIAGMLPRGSRTLQRFDEADALPVHTSRARVDRLPV